MKRNIVLIVLGLAVASCGKKDGPAPDPSKAMLVFPEQNAACTVGRTISATESAIRFNWNDAINAESYELSLKNLKTGATSTHLVTQSEIEITLPNNTAFSWFVTSKLTKSSGVAQSDTWKFYSVGNGTESYVPFPAEIVTPLMSQNIGVSTSKVTLDWTGADVDNDIVNYDVYFGTSSSPALYRSNLTESILNDVPLNPTTLYFWKVVTKDLKGNTSDSGVFQFRTY